MLCNVAARTQDIRRRSPAVASHSGALMYYWLILVLQFGFGISDGLTYMSGASSVVGMCILIRHPCRRTKVVEVVRYVSFRYKPPCAC